MDTTGIIGYQAGGYAWCLKCFQEGASQAHDDQVITPLPAGGLADDNIFCDGCGKLVLPAAPGFDQPSDELELGTPEAG